MSTEKNSALNNTQIELLSYFHSSYTYINYMIKINSLETNNLFLKQHILCYRA